MKNIFAKTYSVIIILLVVLLGQGGQFVFAGKET
ncbi:MAG: hypothetical protein ACD_15C00161G0001 [uncultured bacterium]|nr:MAG: hypothetical protein ACD_15C00161G0001 [uncultured bacterium]